MADDLDVLCGNVSQWIKLQTQEASSLLADAEQAHQALVTRLSAAEHTMSCELSSAVNLAAALPHEGGAHPPPPQRAVTLTTPAPEVAARPEASRQQPAAMRSPMALRSPTSKPVTPAAHSPDSFPAIETMLARRQRRLARGCAATPLAKCLSFDRDEQADAQLVTLSPHLPWAAAAAMRLVMLRGSFHELVANATVLMPQDSSSRTLRDAWRRLAQAASARGSELAGAVVRCAAAAAASRRLLLAHTWLSWRHVCASTAALLRQRVAIHAALFRTGLRRWCRWLRRAASWRRRAQRRVAALGGGHRVHLPCMRTFEPHAIFLEEGSRVMADAYRERRMLAVRLCHWITAVHRMSESRSNEEIL